MSNTISNESPQNISPINIDRIALGVRYQPKYAVLDNIGSIIDRILRSPGSPFGPTTFPLSTRGPYEHSLFNENNGNQLRLTQSDAILEIQVGTNQLDRLTELAQNYESFVLNNLREVSKVRDIVRYGVLIKFDESRNALGISPIQHYLYNDFNNARSLNLRFTRRLPLDEALVKKNVQDYRNVIYNIDQNEDGEVRISMDYQEYFNPALSSDEWAKKPFAAFVQRGIFYFNGEFSKWLEKLLRKDKAA